MIWNLSLVWIFVAVSTVGLFALVLGMALDGLMGDDGFGAIGNMLVITAGFFLAIYVANAWGIRLNDMTLATATGLGGAFVTLFGLALGKGVLGRMMG